MEQIITYHADMVRLASQGVPIDWEKVAAAMANTIKAEAQKQQAEANKEQAE